MPNSPQSSYLQYLPAVFHTQPFIGAFLLAFEGIFSGLPVEADIPAEHLPDDLPDGYDALLDRIDTFFIPQADKDKTTNDSLPLKKQRTPTEFLPWLAQWVALSLRDDWDEPTQRQFISEIVPLYRLRGTKIGLEKLLRLYTNEEVDIYEPAAPPHYFQVSLVLSEANPDQLRKKERIAHALIQQEKPAHTVYALRIRFPTMRIINQPPEGSQGLILGETTLLGTDNSKREAENSS